MARLGTSMLAVARLRQSCAKVDDTQWIRALERWRAKLEIGRTVDLAWSPAVSVPVVLGWLHPMIVLPSSLIGKSSREHSDAVLLHELSHVRRGDYPWNLCLRFVHALYWPHVLVWLLGRASATLRERACDDLCVHEMGGPSVYREALLAVAADNVRRPSPALGLAMAHPSKLGRRLARIEQSNGHELCVPCRPVGLAIAALVITLAGLIGSIHLVRAQAPAATLEAPPAAARRPAACFTSRLLPPTPESRSQMPTCVFGLACVTNGARPMRTAVSTSGIPPVRPIRTSASTSGARAARCSATVGTRPQQADPRRRDDPAAIG